MGNLCPRRHQWPEEYEDEPLDEGTDEMLDDVADKVADDGTDEWKDEGQYWKHFNDTEDPSQELSAGPSPSRPHHWSEYSPTNPRRKPPSRVSEDLATWRAQNPVD